MITLTESTFIGNLGLVNSNEWYLIIDKFFLNNDVSIKGNKVLQDHKTEKDFNDGII